MQFEERAEEADKRALAELSRVIVGLLGEGSFGRFGSFTIARDRRRSRSSWLCVFAIALDDPVDGFAVPHLGLTFTDQEKFSRLYREFLDTFRDGRIHTRVRSSVSVYWTRSP